jgi:FkbM family methyltransferase
MIDLLNTGWKRIRKWSNPSFLAKVIEINRISSVPRFQIGETKILGKRLIFSDSASFIQSYHEIFEQELYFYKSENSSPLILDCGTNIGLSVIFLKKLYPNARIIGFEPDPNLFKILKDNLKQFGLMDVELHQKAVLDLTGKVSFNSQGASSGQVLMESERLTTDSVIEVDSVTLSPFITSSIDFLKIDIEGAEYRVLKSIEDRLHLVKRIFVEYHSFSNHEQELDGLLALLRKASFRYYLYPAVHKEFPFKGIDFKEEMDMQLNIYAIRQ